jgi:thioredoxin 1
MNTEYADVEPLRSDIDAVQSPAVIEFGVPWCPHCQLAQPLIAAAFAGHSAVRHIKVEDGSGRPLGRSFRVKLWPTLIFMTDGKEVARVVRPTDTHTILQAFAQIDSSPSA